MIFSKKAIRILFIPLILLSIPALAQNFEYNGAKPLPSTGPGVENINEDALIIKGVTTTTESPITTTYGGASLTVTDSVIDINGAKPYAAGLAGYNAPAPGGAPTTFEGSAFIIASGNLTSGMDSGATGPGAMNFSGSFAHLEGEDPHSAVIYGYGIDAKRGQIITLDQTPIITQNKRSGSILTNYGTVNVNSGSSITADKGGTLQLNTGVWKESGMEFSSDPDNISVYNINSGGALTAEGGTIASENPLQLEINVASGGKINAENGAINLQNGDWDDGSTLNSEGALTVSGASGNIWVGQLNIKGGTVNLAGNPAASSGQWNTLSGYRGVEISGGDITLNAGSEIQAGSAAGMQIKGGSINLAGSGAHGQPGSAQLRFSGNGANSIEGGTITVEEGKQGSIATGHNLAMSGGGITVAGTLNLAGSDIGAGGNQKVDSYAMNMTGGAITVGENGALNITNDLAMTVNGGALTNSGTVAIGGGKPASLSFTAEDAQKAFDALSENGVVTLGGTENGAASLSFNGDLSIVAKNLGNAASEKGQIGMGEYARLETSGMLTLTDTTEANIDLGATNAISAGGLALQGGSPALTSGTVRLNGISAGAAALKGDGLAVNGGTLILGDAGGNSPGGSIESDLSANGGAVEINSGEWTLGNGKTVNVESGKMQIGGQIANNAPVAASLDARQGNLEIAQAAGLAEGTLSTGVGVLDGGALITNFDQLFAADPEDIKLLDSVQQMYLADNGAITIAKTTVNQLSDLDKYRKALVGDSSLGTVNWQDISVTDNPIPGTEAEGIKGDNVFASNDLAYGDDGRYDASSKTVAVANESSVGGKTIVLTGEAATGATTLAIGDPDGASPNTLTLLGETAGTNLIVRDEPKGEAAANVTKVAVQPNATLKLGSESVTNKSQGGKLGGDVSLADGATLETEAGNFSTGAITALDDASTHVIVKAGSSLSAPVAGSSNAPITTMSNDGDLNIASGLVAESVENAGNIVAGSMAAGTLASSGNLDLGSATLGSGDAPTNSVITSGTANIKDLGVSGRLTVGGNGAAPNLNVKAASLASGRLVFDHAGSGMARGQIESFGQTGADMDVLRNAIVTVGSGAPSGWADAALPKTGLTASNNGTHNSVLAVYTPLTVKNGGSISVGTVGASGAPMARAMRLAALPAPRAAASTVQLGEKSILLINGPTAGNGAIMAAGPAPGKTTAVAEINPKAKVAIAGARPNTAYTIFAVNPDNHTGWQVVNSENETQPGLTAEQIAADNPLMKDFTVAMTPDGSLIIHSEAATPAAQVFPAVDGQLANVLDIAFANNQIGVEPEFTHAGARGTQFLSRSLVMANNGLADKAGRALESAGRMLSLGAAPQMTLTASRAAGSAVTQRASLAVPPGNLYAMNTNGETGSRAPKDYAGALWIMPLFQSTNGFSMKAGPHDYDFSGTLGGVAIGADYTVNDMGRFGVAFNIGGGYAEGSGTLNKTTNNMNFWGVGAYAGANQDNFGLVADIFYTSTYNKLRQDTPAEMSFGTLKADVRGHAISTGLRAEYKIPTEAMDIIPHAGFRYTNLKMDSYKIKSAGTVIKGNSTEQNIWQFPVGVTMTRVVELDQGWRFKPLLDLNVIPAAGNFDTKNKIRFTGTGTKAELETKSMDYITYGGTVGLEFSNDNLSLGINYSGEFGEESSAHGVFGTLRYEF